MTDRAGVLDVLNDDQRRAATHQGGPLLILAGAGTGKTGTLVARAAWLRGQGLQASRILLLTFTRRAADDMLARAHRDRPCRCERRDGHAARCARSGWYGRGSANPAGGDVRRYLFALRQHEHAAD